jgi:Aspartokinases
MKIIVLKFGGTSVGTVDRIKNVANIITSYIKKKYKVIVVSSAMSGVTNDLIRKSEKISNDFDVQELDVLLSTGEQIACSLLAGRLRHLGYNSRSWLAWQIPIITSGDYNSSRIININENKIHKIFKI